MIQVLARALLMAGESPRGRDPQTQWPESGSHGICVWGGAATIDKFLLKTNCESPATSTFNQCLLVEGKLSPRLPLYLLLHSGFELGRKLTLLSESVPGKVPEACLS